MAGWCVFAARFELPFGQVVRCHVTAILRPCHFRGIFQRQETDNAKNREKKKKE